MAYALKKSLVAALPCYLYYPAQLVRASDQELVSTGFESPRLTNRADSLALGLKSGAVVIYLIV